MMISILMVTITIMVATGFAAVAVYIERKIASFIQCRLGPMDVGPPALVFRGKTLLPAGWYGVGTIIGDGVKLLAKEDIIPDRADPILFRLAPYVVFTSILLAFSVVPFGAWFFPADIDAGILFLLAAMSVGIYGTVMGGYASNNKWSLYGAIRSIAQVISYEIPLGLALLSVVITVGSLSLGKIADAQTGWFWNWHIFQNVFLFIAFFIYAIASLAEVNRTPFDLPEAESELVAGYLTEYSGMRYGLFFLSEYTAMLLVSLVGALVFLGGPNTGLPFATPPLLAPLVLFAKAGALVLVMIWLRWTLPRFRVDHLMLLCWKGLLPLSLIAFVGAGIAVFQTAMPFQIFWRLLIVAVIVGFVASVREKKTL